MTPPIANAGERTLDRIPLQLDALLSDGTAESNRVDGSESGQAAQNGQLGTQLIALTAGCKDPARCLLDKAERLVCEQSRHGGRNLC